MSAQSPDTDCPVISLRLRGVSGGISMNSVIYIVGLVVVVIAVLSFFGLR